MGNSPSDRGSVYAEDGETPRLYALAKIKPDQWPILYDPVYNITFAGMEKIHPFDSGKWGKIFKNLVGERLLLRERLIWIEAQDCKYESSGVRPLHYLVQESLPLSSDPW